MIEKKSKFVFEVEEFHARVSLIIMYGIRRNNYIGRNIFSQFYVFKSKTYEHMYVF
jgi:hypothetical protein